MPINPTYPGVYVEEIPSGVRTISGVATSITAFVGRAKKGITNEPVNIYNYGDYERNFGGLSELSPMSFAVRDFFLNGGGEAIIVRLDKNAVVAAKKNIAVGTGKLTLEASSSGKWGNDLEVVIDHKTKDPSDTKLFNLSVSHTDGSNEKHLNLTIESGKSNYIKTYLLQNSGLLRAKFTATPTARPAAAATSIKLIDGTDGDKLDDTAVKGSEANKTGMYALEKADLFNLLCIPPFVENSEGKAIDVTKTIIATAEAYCKKRRAVLLIDPLSSWNTAKKAEDQVSNATYPGTNSNYTALYFPRIIQANPLMDNQLEEFVPSGTVAGIIARTDTERGIWKAPAGTDATISGASGLSVPLTDEENGKLNQKGVNCLRSFPVYGRLVWGSRTREGADVLASEWKYLPVRRTALYIEESLFRGLKWVVFEPNDEPLWGQIRLNVGAFMHNMFKQGAFQGNKKEAYFVKCDSETTTQNDINLGIVNIVVGFAPLKPAEFVIIKLQQIAGQIDT